MCTDHQSKHLLLTSSHGPTHIKVILGVPKLFLGKDPTEPRPTLIDRLVRTEHEHAQHVLVRNLLRDLRDHPSQPILDLGCKDVQPLGSGFQRRFLGKRRTSLVWGQRAFPPFTELVGDLDELDVVAIAFAFFTGLVARERTLDEGGGGLDVSLGGGRPEFIRRGRFLMLGILVRLLVAALAVLVVFVVFVMLAMLVFLAMPLFNHLERILKLARLPKLDNLQHFRLLALVRFTRMRGGEEMRVGRLDRLSKGLAEGTNPNDTTHQPEPRGKRLRSRRASS